MKHIFALIFSAAVVSFSYLSANNITISGRIIDAATGNAVASATIHTKNGRYSTLSGNDGTFSLSVPEQTKMIIISAVGYEQQEMKVKGNNVGDIKLHPASNALEEVVVIGYGDSRGRSTRKLSSGQAPNAVASISPYPNYEREFNTEDYDAITENRFLEAATTPLSTFSIDVDGASYSNVRRFLKQGMLPPAGSVRVEEMINYFRYNYPQPNGETPFSVSAEAGECPWNKDHQLVMIGLQGKKISVEKLPPGNLVFLIDVSGSMMNENKLPLVKSSLKLLTEQLREEDRVSIVVYAGSAGLVLPSTSGSNKQKIVDAIEQLEAGGSTAGGEGIRLAYDVARKNFAKEGNNRVILCTDGDFNVGMSSDAELEKLIEHERESGVFLTILGYGMGNYKDNKMQKLAQKGNGNHSYIDNITEAKKVLVNEFGGTLFTIAKDVKLQVEFNPAYVQGYRLIGYENRMLNKEDFNNDKKDAGEIGSGHTVTALYEVIPVGIKSKWLESVDPLKYQNQNKKTNSASGEMMNVKIRYKKPEGQQSMLIEHPVSTRIKDKPSSNFLFAAAVAQYGMLLNGSEFRQSSSFSSALDLAKRSISGDTEGYRAEFVELVEVAERLGAQAYK